MWLHLSPLTPAAFVCGPHFSWELQGCPPRGWRNLHITTWPSMWGADTSSVIHGISPGVERSWSSIWPSLKADFPSWLCWWTHWVPSTLTWLLQSITVLSPLPTTRWVVVWGLLPPLTKCLTPVSYLFSCLPQSKIWELLEVMLEVTLPLKERSFRLSSLLPF